MTEEENNEFDLGFNTGTFAVAFTLTIVIAAYILLVPPEMFYSLLIIGTMLSIWFAILLIMTVRKIINERRNKVK